MRATWVSLLPILSDQCLREEVLRVHSEAQEAPEWSRHDMTWGRRMQSWGHVRMEGTMKRKTYRGRHWIRGRNVTSDTCIPCWSVCFQSWLHFGSQLPANVYLGKTRWWFKHVLPSIHMGDMKLVSGSCLQLWQAFGERTSRCKICWSSPTLPLPLQIKWNQLIKKTPHTQ